MTDPVATCARCPNPVVCASAPCDTAILDAAADEIVTDHTFTGPRTGRCILCQGYGRDHAIVPS